MSIGEGTRSERDVRTVPAQGASVPSQLSGHYWTGSVLNALPPEWTVLHARHWPGRSYDVIDHLAIGPNGIFVIDSVGWSGEVTSTPDVLEVNGRTRLTALQGAQDSAREVALLLSPEVREHVFPVICLSREEQVTGWVKAVRICSTTTVNDLIESRPPVLTAEQVDRISRELDDALPSGQSVNSEWVRAGDHHHHPLSLVTDAPAPPPRVRAPWRRSRIGRIAEALLGLGVVATLAVAGWQMALKQAASSEDPSQPAPGQHQPTN
jgi:hypothetical protein